jgi:hypothetical protein
MGKFRAWIRGWYYTIRMFLFEREYYNILSGKDVEYWDGTESWFKEVGPPESRGPRTFDPE